MQRSILAFQQIEIEEEVIVSSNSLIWELSIVIVIWIWILLTLPYEKQARAIRTHLIRPNGKFDQLIQRINRLLIHSSLFCAAPVYTVPLLPLPPPFWGYPMFFWPHHRTLGSCSMTGMKQVNNLHFHLNPRLCLIWPPTKQILNLGENMHMQLRHGLSVKMKTTIWLVEHRCAGTRTQ